MNRKKCCNRSGVSVSGRGPADVLEELVHEVPMHVLSQEPGGFAPLIPDEHLQTWDRIGNVRRDPHQLEHLGVHPVFVLAEVLAEAGTVGDGRVEQLLRGLRVAEGGAGVVLEVQERRLLDGMLLGVPTDEPEDLVDIGGPRRPYVPQALRHHAWMGVGVHETRQHRASTEIDDLGAVGEVE
jgi:hypothetical protein